MHTFHKQSPHELSGGQKQTVSLAGLLTTNADILLFDEPLANLDPLSALHTIKLMKIYMNNIIKRLLLSNIE